MNESNELKSLASEKVTLEKKLIIEKTFTTGPKTRRHRRKPKHIRRTVNALRDSFYPTVRVSYNAVARRLQTQFELCSPQTILSYLGRTSKVTTTPIDHTVKYQKTGTVVFKQHKMRRVLPAIDGYITLFEVGSLELDENLDCWVVWNHEVQTEISPLSPHSEGYRKGCGGSSKNFISPYSSLVEAKDALDNVVGSELERDRRERESYREIKKTLERSGESESIPEVAGCASYHENVKENSVTTLRSSEEGS